MMLLAHFGSHARRGARDRFNGYPLHSCRENRASCIVACESPFERRFERACNVEGDIHFSATG
ncbi:hypothetical protein BURCENBC7_AP0622 [Burkholderia cenocepacia BC7]|nr:hypothetical protein BURCENK562V_C6963 [Burkholderia cenocepacia K56-2Valvano]ERI25082.1 hypothetical protein BURCENBC7_AP0622 [Burkholderia cenocepacia BC7]